MIWFIIRGSGIAAIALLTAAVLWGLLISTKTFGRAIKAKGLTGLHESLGIATFVTLLVHIVAVTMDEYIGFTWADVLIPGKAQWEPTAMALGVISFWMLIPISLSFYVKKWIGQTAWRIVHRMSVGVFVAAIAHGALAGTDTSSPWMLGMYVGSVVLVALLTVVRIMLSNEPQRAKRPATPRPATTTIEAVPSEVSPTPEAHPVSPRLEPVAQEA